jgi:ElaB/YqjD/DUF883 family membrane-anchored ribosome-binding protein
MDMHDNKTANDSEKPMGFEGVKNAIADKLRGAAAVLGARAAEQDEQTDLAQYEKQASAWLAQSAECVREFDYKQTDAKVREYVGRRPERSLLIAGAVGLIVGSMIRRS